MKWKFRDRHFGIDDYTDITKLSAALLSVKNIAPSEVSGFMNPALGSMPSPFLFRDMEKAVDRIDRAIHNNENVLIHGDYDVDGVTSLSLLYRNLRKMGMKSVIPYIPNRFDEGYGLSMQAIEKAIASNVSLIITVDCGISGFTEIEAAKSNGIDVIVTDHHEIPARLPPAYAILDPELGEYPSKELAGVGVAFKLLQALYEKRRLDNKSLLWDLDLVALGTISDVVPLVGENRIIVRNGLLLLRDSQKAGIRALKQIAGVNGSVNTYHVGFILAPRLNAAGRIQDAHRAFDLLITKDGKKAREYAVSLNNLNLWRQKIERDITEQANNMAKGFSDDELIYVMFDKTWHEGVIGIVASRIAGRFYRPAILLTEKGDGVIKGSARSIPGFSIYEAIESQSHLLLSFGGHKYAAGLSLMKKNLQAFRKGINEYATKKLSGALPEPEVFVDVDATGFEITERFFEEFEKFRPFGNGNPSPVFLFRGALVKGMPRNIGARGVKLNIDFGYRIFSALYFPDDPSGISLLKHNRKIDVLFNLKIDKYLERYVLQIIDFKVVAPSKV